VDAPSGANQKPMGRRQRMDNRTVLPLSARVWSLLSLGMDCHFNVCALGYPGYDCDWPVLFNGEAMMIMIIYNV
jgi:hypothetical protein